MKRVKILVGLLFLATATVGCSDFLSEVPDNRTQIDTPKKVSELLVGAYPSATHVEFTEEMSDNVIDNGKLNQSTLQSEQNFTWVVNTEESYETPKAFWMACYEAIANANAALDALSSMEKEYANKPSFKYGLTHLRAEALLARAYNHFMLVNLWAKHYNPATAESDLGIPYVTEVENVLLKEYKRLSVAEVYKLIEQDLLEGLIGIKGAQYESANIAKYHFTEASAKAFAARFYLYKGEFAKSIEYSNTLGDLPIGKLRDVAGTADFSTAQNEIHFSRTELDTNLLVVTSPSRKKRTTYASRFVLTQGEATKGDKGLFSSSTNPVSEVIKSPMNWNYPNANYSNNDAFYVPKFNEYFKINDFTNMTGIPHVTFVLFSNDMLYLDRMEAFVMENRIDEAIKMYTYLVLLRTELPPQFKPESLIGILQYEDIEKLIGYEEGKYSPITKINREQAVMLEAISEMRRREGFQEGYRWFDIRRFNLEVKHKLTGGSEHILQKGDLRYQLQLPQVALDRGIPANPR